MNNLEITEIAKIDNLVPYFKTDYYDVEKDKEWIISLDDLKGKWTILFFYPADFTFVCPTELKDIADIKEKFDNLWIEVLAISADTIFSHRAWVKHEKLLENFKFKMLSDHSLKISKMFNILDEETWIAWRWTFIIDKEWILKGIEVTTWPLWRSSDELLRKMEALQFIEKNPWLVCPAKWKTWDKTIKPSIKISWEVAENLK